MDNFMFQKLMAVKKEEEKKLEEEVMSKDTEIEILEKEENVLGQSFSDFKEEENMNQGYVARKNNE